MSTISDVLWDNLLRELRDIHRFVTTGQQLRRHLDAYIDARIAEKAAKPEPTPITPTPTAREVHKAWLKWLSTPCGDGRPSLPSFPELEK